MPLLVHAVRGTFTLHGKTIEHPRLAHSKIGHIDHLLDLAFAFSPDLPHFETYQGAQFFLLFTKSISKLPDNITSFGGRNRFPFPEGLSGFLYHLVTVRLIGTADLSDDPAVDRRNDIEQLPRAGNPMTDACSGLFFRQIQFS
jgi:hypothetical protein